MWHNFTFPSGLIRRSDYWSNSCMPQPIWARLGQLVHMISSPVPFRPTRCCPHSATSAHSHHMNTATILYIWNLCNCDSITSYVYTILGNTHEVLAMKWRLGGTDQNRCVASGWEKYWVDISQFSKIKLISRYSTVRILTERSCSELYGANVVSMKDIFSFHVVTWQWSV